MCTLGDRFCWEIINKAHNETIKQNVSKITWTISEKCKLNNFANCIFFKLIYLESVILKKKKNDNTALSGTKYYFILKSIEMKIGICIIKCKVLEITGESIACLRPMCSMFVCVIKSNVRSERNLRAVATVKQR